MYRVTRLFRNFIKGGDLILLLLCLVANIFGCVVVASTTNTMGSTRYVIIQIAAALIGVLLYILITNIDTEIFSENRWILICFNLFLLLLLIPFGTDNGTGNKSWLDIPLVPVDIQPAEICKISFVLVLASVMNSHQSRISSPKSVLHMVFHLLLLVGLNMVLSRVLGVSMIFGFIFAGMAFAGGVSLIWFGLAVGLIVTAWPFFWNYFLDGYQKQRIQILYDPTIDPQGIGPRYHSKMSLRSLTGGGLTGQGLFNGNRTQTPDALFAQHTDYIFSAIGEELGYVGCVLVVLLLLLIVARCIYVGMKTPDYMRRLVCFGAAAALSFQIISNVGMCIGITPVIGLTLPFISYGGSSLVSLYALMGLVSGVHARPTAPSHERYIRLPPDWGDR